MGGSSGSTNREQALKSSTGATGSAQSLTQLGTQQNAQQQQLYNLLWGSPGGVAQLPAPPATATPQQNFGATGQRPTGKNVNNVIVGGPATAGGGAPGAPGGTGAGPSGAPSGGATPGGALTGFLNPESLKVSSPTGTYALQNTMENQNAQVAEQQQEAAIKRNAANAGFGAGSPAGFTADQVRQAQQSEANQRGANFATNASNSYQDALANFWKAANIASGTQAGSGAAAAGDVGGAGSIYNNLYGMALKAPGGGGGTNTLTNALNMTGLAAQSANSSKGGGGAGGGGGGGAIPAEYAAAAAA